MDKRDKLANQVLELIEREEKIEKEKITSTDYGRNKKKLKNGIYCIYDEKDTIIYVGKVGDSKSTSLYDRMIGHGDGSHSKKEWWSSAKYVKFRIFESVNESQLSQLERLTIIAANNPNNNDKIINDKDISVLTKLIGFQE
jgi:excinuclease UvrABC nuclease subunit